MEIHLCTQVKKNCWNFYDSYGEICVHCGCCSKNALIRTKARLSVLKRELEESENFDGWAYEYPDLLELQKKNVAEDIVYFKKKIKYYEQKLSKLEGEK